MFGEVAKIVSKDVFDFTTTAFYHAPGQFWDSPCSSSGKFHPPEDNGSGGLVRHLVKASYVADQFARKFQFSDYEKDLAKSATLLHDICKDGNPWSGSTDYRHGLIGSNFLSNFPLADKTAKQIILDSVRYHMSPWNTTFSPEKYFLLNGKGGKAEDQVIITPEEIRAELAEVKRGLMPHSAIETCVQHADYWASREGMSFFPGINVDMSARHD